MPSSEDEDDDYDDEDYDDDNDDNDHHDHHDQHNYDNDGMSKGDDYNDHGQVEDYEYIYIYIS